VTHTEHNYRERSRLLFKAAEQEHDPVLREALYIQSERVGMKALHLELERKQNMLWALGMVLSA
jgi:hypothetical protein